ncbi:MAG: hypothetical protein WC551_10800 [Patescibacteria group bacterium]
MKTIYWRIRLMFWLAYYHYHAWWDIRALASMAWDDDCWGEQINEMSPRDAVLEDLSNA